MPLRVWSPGSALAEVVEQGAEQQQVGPIDAVGQRGRVGRRLPQVPVDGEAVVRVALRSAAHGAPTRAGCARAGHAGRATRTRRWRGDPGRAGRPARRARRRANGRPTPRRRRLGESVEGAARQQHAALRRQVGGAQQRAPDRRPGRPVRSARPRGRPPRHRRRRAPRGRAGAARRGATRRAAIHAMLRPAAATSAISSSADAIPEPGGHGVLVLEAQHVARPALLPVQGDAHVDERAVATARASARSSAGTRRSASAAHHSVCTSRSPPWPSLRSGSRR